MKEDYDFLIEWAIWGRLDSKTDLELILLKGHLLIEPLLDVKLERSGITNNKKLSFYSKVLAIERLDFEQLKMKKIIIDSLKELNKMRNDLAHDYKYDVHNGKLEVWAKVILDNLNGEKYSKFTFRTKIVHAFSTLAINILELTDR